MNAQEKVFEKLNELNIKYEVVNHPAVFTIEEMDNLGITFQGDVCKNLFLRDEKGKRHFLVVLDKDKKADLKNIQKQLGSTRLSFASAERLDKYLKLQKGEVTPLGVINDINASVEVAFDNDLLGRTKLGVHPNDNTATVWISFEDLIKVVEQNGNKITYVTI
ncbi:prolyl-tRNA synthetase associated domain-containing protein [Clostridiaceae bacterium UIB06]|uniref:Prolyl-tRNA synthetase associated domain-containing protein n=1 Tax=Clostridium thailandense TaxID=2794346 RepID=A0A949TL21_9CLOT|nr:prolyl-tRNA synthetase associated domain-containing protein [Clostridium thailandense]MBV7274275.1 prolyl-tRNA synthetase associated domain-containing protein [Clostridium thailandense]MCH5136175.1 prolyl-tRNA synthetase associated domain-containing protein [Clostridiaceae bacterium UIB06]